MPMFVDHRFSSIQAAATAAADGQLHLQFAQRLHALIDGAADLAIGNPVANANVHSDLLTCRRDVGANEMQLNHNANANDCQSGFDLTRRSTD